MQVAAAISGAGGQTPLFLGSWGSYSINDVSAIMPVFFGGGNDDYARDPEMQKLMPKAAAAPIRKRARRPKRRHRASTENAYWLPLHTYVTTYGFSRQLNFKPYRGRVAALLPGELEIGRWG